MSVARIVSNRNFIRVKYKKVYYEWLKQYGNDPGLPDRMIGDEEIIAVPSFIEEAELKDCYPNVLRALVEQYYVGVDDGGKLDKVKYKKFLTFFDIKFIDTCIDIGQTPFNVRIKTMKSY